MYVIPLLIVLFDNCTDIILSSSNALLDATPHIIEFENKLELVKYKRCDACLSVKLLMKTREDMGGQTLCSVCHQNGYNRSMFAHPTWFDCNKEEHLEVPDPLLDLREGEKLLIQQISPYVPLMHLQKGSFGCKGHVCSFPQDLQSVCTVLPRLPSDVTVVNVVKT